MTNAYDRLVKIDHASALPGCSDGVQAAWAYSPEEWRDKGLQIARALAMTGKPFSVDDIQRMGLPEPDSNRSWGALMASIRKFRIAEFAGWTAHHKNGVERPVRLFHSPSAAEDPQ